MKTHSLRVLRCFVGIVIAFASANLSAATLHVSLDSPNPSPPYADWATVAHVIQDAVDAAQAGDLVLITNGVYVTGGRSLPDLGASRVVVTNALRLVSVNGPAVTVIEGDTNVARCALVGDGAVLSGFTLTKSSGRGAECAESGVLTNCVLTANFGGGVAGGTLYSCVLSENSAEAGGGAYESTLYNCTLRGNSGRFGGGAISGTLHGCLVEGNSAGQGGGTQQSVLYSCTLKGNVAEIGGGSCSGELHNCLVTDNSAGQGGGAAGGQLYNCTVTGNTADVAGGVGWNDWLGGTPTLVNCVVYGNRADDGANYEFGRFAYSCTTPVPPGPGNIGTDPRMASSTRLSVDSPCLGAGSSEYATGTDLDGEPWANPPSIGADEIWPGQTVGPLAMRIEAAFTEVASGFSAPLTAHSAGALFKSIWDFGDGISVTNQAFTSHAWAAPGTYLVRLTGYNDSHPEGVSTSVKVTVVEAIHYVNVANAAPSFPYASWATAATNIQDAIVAATLPGHMVLVTNGVYRTGTVETNGVNRVALTNRVVVRSVNGPKVTVIEGAQYDPTTFEGVNVRCAYVGEGSVLSGMTLTLGGAEHGGGVLADSFGVVTNCLISGNRAVHGGGAEGGTHYDCRITENEALGGGIKQWRRGGQGGGARFATLHNCRVSNNQATGFSDAGGGGVAVSTLTNCTLTGNSAVGSGGGAIGSTLCNCTLIGNSAGYGGGVLQGTLENCTLSGNVAYRGGGTLDGLLRNCTLTDNAAEESGGGAAGGTLYNCIVYFNQAPDGINWSDSTFEYSCTTPLPPGPGNIAGNPLFVDAAAGDFRLRPDSPCIDAGTNLTASLTTGILGLPRPLDGNGDGIARSDMGAYEFNPYRFGPVFRPAADGFRLTVNGEPGWTVRVERSRDLATWEVVATVPIPASGQTLIDPAATSERMLFYRATSVP